MHLAKLAPALPQVVVVYGTGKVEQLPVKERRGQSNQEWFELSVRSGKYRKNQINGQIEGYDTVVYREIDDGR